MSRDRVTRFSEDKIVQNCGIMRKHVCLGSWSQRIRDSFGDDIINQTKELRYENFNWYNNIYKVIRLSFRTLWWTNRSIADFRSLTVPPANSETSYHLSRKIFWLTTGTFLLLHIWKWKLSLLNSVCEMSC